MTLPAKIVTFEFMILALLRIVFIVIILYVIFFVVRLFQTIGKSKPRRRNEELLRGTMVKDESCNMYLPKEEAFREVIDGKEYFFCSKECRNDYIEKKRSSS